MRIIVNDTSCMIHLRKAGILEALLRLPYSFVMPDSLFEGELLSWSQTEKRVLIDLGLEVQTLPDPLVERARLYYLRHTRLELNDCFALVLAEETENCILLTGDSYLRKVAVANEIEVHGVLWATDEMEAHSVVPLQVLFDALQFFQDDENVYLPIDEIVRRKTRVARLLGHYRRVPPMQMAKMRYSTLDISVSCKSKSNEPPLSKSM